MNLIQLAEVMKSARPMTDLDYQAWSGAPRGSLIAESEVAIYIISDNEVSVITEDTETRYEFNKLFEIGV